MFKDLILSKAISFLRRDGPSTCNVLVEKINETGGRSTTVPQLSNWMAGDPRFSKKDATRDRSRVCMHGGKIYIWDVKRHE